MSTATQVHNAESINEALLAIAEALDRIEGALQVPPPQDQWSKWQPQAPKEFHHHEGEWKPFNPIKAEREAAAGLQVTVGEDASEVAVPPVNDMRLNARYIFARDVLKLDTYAKAEASWADKPDNYNSWAAVYAKGGPAWLYHSNRECVMAYPIEVRRRMVDDLIEDDPVAAHEMGRDVLKADAESGPGNGVGPDPSFGS